MVVLKVDLMDDTKVELKAAQKEMTLVETIVASKAVQMVVELVGRLAV